MTAAPDGSSAQRLAGGGRSLAVRIARAWRALEAPQRLSAYACAAMFAAMFLPWYAKSVTAIVTQGREQELASRSENLSAWAAFSFVEAASLLVAVSVLVLLFLRGEGRGFHLPGGDGTVIAAAGGWAAFLIFYRLLDQPDAETTSTLTTSYGLRWGIFLALGAALFLSSSGVRMRAAHLVEPPLPEPHTEPRARPPATTDEPPTRVDSTLQPTRVVPGPRTRPGSTADGGEQLSFDEQE